MPITTLLSVTPALRIRPENANHHLWNNHGTWFLHYTVYPTPFTKARIRRSLGTKDITVARERRDTFFAHLGHSGASASACHPLDDIPGEAGREPSRRKAAA